MVCRALAFAPLYNEDTATSPEHLVLLFWGGSSSAHCQDVLLSEGAVLIVGVDRKRGAEEKRVEREERGSLQHLKQPSCLPKCPSHDAKHT